MEDLKFKFESDFIILDTLLPKYCQIEDDLIYHYTDKIATYSILDKGLIWASNVAHMNDESELKYARDLIKIEIRKRLSKKPDKLTLFILEDIESHLLSRKRYGIYVISFSTVRDDLNQWMKYTPGKLIRCCLGFSSFDLKSRIPVPGSLYKVIYDPNEQIKLINLILDYLLNYFDTIRYEYGSDIIYDQLLLEYSRRYLEFIIPLIKNPEFSSENEVRAILVRKDLSWIAKLPVRKRPAITRSIQYIEFPLLMRISPSQNKLPIEEILLQCSNYSSEKHNLRNHLNSTNNKKIAISKSEKTFRVI